MTRVGAAAVIMRRAARGDCRCQVLIALEILHLSEQVDPLTAVIMEVQALCYARLAAAHGDVEALHLAAMLAAKIANHEDGSSLGLAVREMRADALAMLDVAADLAKDEMQGAIERHLHDLSAKSDAKTAELAQPHRELWGLIVSPELEKPHG